MLNSLVAQRLSRLQNDFEGRNTVKPKLYNSSDKRKRNNGKLKRFIDMPLDVFLEVSFFRTLMSSFVSDLVPLLVLPGRQFSRALGFDLLVSSEYGIPYHFHVTICPVRLDKSS